MVYTRYIIPDIRLCQSCKLDISGKLDISSDISLSFFIVCNLIELALTSTMRIYL